jgi:hypothetical protein
MIKVSELQTLILGLSQKKRRNFLLTSFIKEIQIIYNIFVKYMNKATKNNYKFGQTKH